MSVKIFHRRINFSALFAKTLLKIGTVYIFILFILAISNIKMEFE